MPSRASPFTSRVRLLLVLLALVLAAANIANFLLVRAARDGLREGESGFASVVARRALREAGEASIARALADPASLSVRYPPTRLRAWARRLDLLAVDLVSPDGQFLSASSPSKLGGRDPHLDLVRPDGSVAVQESWAGPVDVGGQSSIVYYLPVSEGTGTPAGYLKVSRASPALGNVERAFRLFAATQAVGLLLAVIAALLISGWIVRPYRLLAQAAGDVPEEIRVDPADAEDPDALVASFLQVLEKMRGQEEELRKLSGGRRSGDPAGSFASAITPTTRSAVVAVDGEGRIVSLNPAAERLLSARSADAVGRPVREAMSCSEDLVRLIGGALAEGRARSRQVVTYRTAAGETGHLGAAVSPVAGEGDAGGGLICLLSDLSEIGSLRDRARLREGMAAVGQISAGIAHEFRNSLGTILGYARLIERAVPGTPAEEHGRAIRREVESIRSAVEEFLRFARPGRLSRSSVSLPRLCRQVAEEVARDREASGLSAFEARIEMDGEMPDVLADETLLRQALGNLFRNAAESSGGRPVTMRVSGRARPDTDGVVLELTDDGEGIPEEDLEKIFVPFFSTKEKGGGLGLAIAQKAILDHDGEIDVTSRPGEGTTFRIVLPRG